jgi:hypothetical protein
MASNSPSSTLRSRVSTLPRMPRTSRSGRAQRLGDAAREPARRPRRAAGRRARVRRGRTGRRAPKRAAAPRRSGARDVARRQVLHRVHDEVALAPKQRVAQRRDEHTRAAELGERPRQDVAVGRDRTSSTSRPVATRSASATWPDCVVASRLARVPSRRCRHRARRHCPAPASAGWKPSRLFSQQPGRHTSYQGPRPSRAGGLRHPCRPGARR